MGPGSLVPKNGGSQPHQVWHTDSLQLPGPVWLEATNVILLSPPGGTGTNLCVRISYSSSPLPFWHYGLVSWKAAFPWTGLGSGFRLILRRIHSLDRLHVQLPVGFVVLWESNATADLTGGWAQVVKWVMGMAVNTDKASFVHLLLTSCCVAWFLTDLCYKVPKCLLLPLSSRQRTQIQGFLVIAFLLRQSSFAGSSLPHRSFSNAFLISLTTFYSNTHFS